MCNEKDVVKWCGTSLFTVYICSIIDCTCICALYMHIRVLEEIITTVHFVENLSPHPIIKLFTGNKYIFFCCLAFDNKNPRYCQIIIAHYDI